MADGPWIELRFERGAWPELRQRQVLNELRLAFELLDVPVCGAASAGDHAASMVIVMNQPTPEAIDVDMVLDNPGPNDPTVHRRIDVAEMSDEDRWLTLALALDDMAQVLWSQRVIPVVVMAPITAPTSVIPSPVVVVVPPGPTSLVTLGGRAVSAWYSASNTTLFGADIFALVDVLGGPVYIEMAFGIRDTLAISTARSEISGRLFGGQVAVGARIWQAHESLALDVDLASRTSLATFDADRSASAWVVDVRGNVQLRWLIGRFFSLRAHASIGAPLTPFTTRVEARVDASSEISVLEGALVSGGLGVGWLFW